MPSRPALSGQLLRNWQVEPYICRNCLLQAVRARTASRTQHQPKSTAPRLAFDNPKNRITGSDTSGPRIQPKNRLQASNGSLASSSAINAPSAVPHRYRDLHQSLLTLQEVASSYVDRSRLQLATRSLESEQPVLRVALLGLGKNGPLTARKLARILLSDALSQEEAWEREILAGTSDGRSLLLKYGDVDEPARSDPLVKVMNVPSRYLARHKLEILITSLNTNSHMSTMDGAAIEDAITVPSLTIPNSATGRVGFVRYPVHKTVIVAEGVTGAIEYGNIAPFLVHNKLINTCISVPLLDSLDGSNSEHITPAIDVELATHALALFRLSKANGAQFSDEWQKSRLPAISDWIAGEKVSPESGMRTAVQELISSVLAGVSSTITRSDEVDMAATLAVTVPENKRVELQSAISAWSADAHRDLQLNLDTAFASSQSWRRTAWWRLFWRIDDVAISASDVLRQSWLKEAEQQLAFLSGRIAETGIASAEELRNVPTLLLDERLGGGKAMEDATRTNTFAELERLPSRFPTKQQGDDHTALVSPWPRTIGLSRLQILNTLVPDLHAKAQTLLLSTLSTIAGSSALAAWFYVATSGVALYESGAILSLGLVWSLRRLQKKWSQERDGFAVVVREDARRVLGEVDSHLRRLIHDGGRAVVNAEDARSRQEAREAVERCRKALDSSVG